VRSRTSSAPPEVEFFVDRSLGKKQLPEALRELGYTVHTVASLFGGEEAAQRVKDVEWLRLAGERGYVVLMKDAVHRVEAQREVLARHQVKAFLLVNRHLTGEQQCATVVANLNRIVQRSRKPGPFVWGIYGDGLKRLWPPT
jgi:hypothetical protein